MSFNIFCSESCNTLLYYTSYCMSLFFQVCESIMKEHVSNLWEDGPNPLYQERFGTAGSTEAPLNETNKSSVCETVKNNIESLGNRDLSESHEPLEKRAKLDDDSPCTGADNPAKCRPGFDKSKLTMVEGCEGCRKTFIDPTEKDLVMFLHALRYKVRDLYKVWDFFLHCERCIACWKKTLLHFILSFDHIYLSSDT